MKKKALSKTVSNHIIYNRSIVMSTVHDIRDEYNM